MRKSMPFRWIEEAEARQVLSAALSAPALRPSCREMARTSTTGWLRNLAARFAPEGPRGWPAPAAQPALVRRTVDHRYRQDDASNFNRW